MIRRSTWILLLIFVVILMVTVYIQTREDADNVGATPTVDVNPFFIHIPEGEEIIGLRIMNEIGSVVDLNRQKSSNRWKLMDHNIDLVDDDRVDMAIARLESVTVKAKVTEDTPLDVIGLTSPAYTITMKLSQGDQMNIHIGEVTITQDSYYGQLETGPAFVVTKSGLDAVINFLDDPPILSPTSTPTPTATITPQP